MDSHLTIDFRKSDGEPFHCDLPMEDDGEFQSCRHCPAYARTSLIRDARTNAGFTSPWPVRSWQGTPRR